MTKEQTLTIIQKTNKKANSIDVVETIKNGQNIKEINSLYIVQPMDGNTLPYFWEKLLENAENKEKEYWNIINKHLETGVFIGLAYVNYNDFDDDKYDEKTQSAPMHYEIDVCGNLINYNYVGEIDENDYMTTTFGMLLKEIKTTLK